MDPNSRRYKPPVDDDSDSELSDVPDDAILNPHGRHQYNQVHDDDEDAEGEEEEDAEGEDDEDAEGEEDDEIEEEEEEESESEEDEGEDAYAPWNFFVRGQKGLTRAGMNTRKERKALRLHIQLPNHPSDEVEEAPLESNPPCLPNEEELLSKPNRSADVLLEEGNQLHHQAYHLLPPRPNLPFALLSRCLRIDSDRRPRDGTADTPPAARARELQRRRPRQGHPGPHGRLLSPVQAKRRKRKKRMPRARKTMTLR